MRAVRIVPGPRGGRLEVQEVAKPVPMTGQVLVRVMAAGLNRGEVNLVRNARGEKTSPAGVEFAGMVESLGDGVTRFAVGDRVMGHAVGGQAEYVVSAERATMKVPDAVDWPQAAAFPNVFITAHDALVTNGALRAGESVLFNAASSGIGLATIRIAAALGASAIFATTRSGEKAKRLSRFGVTHPIDLSTRGQVEAIDSATGGKGVDIVIDSVGGTVFADNLKCLAVKGRLVNIGRLGSSVAEIDLEALWLKRLRLIGVTFRTRSEEERLACVEACARDLLGLFGQGRLDLPIDRVFAMADIAAAHDYIQLNRHFGKIIIAIDDALAASATAK